MKESIVSVELDYSKLAGSKVLIATPMYGGQANVNFYLSMVTLASYTAKHGLHTDFLTVWNESLISRARNTLAHTFLSQDYDYLMFIDSDIGFNYMDFIYMWYLAQTDDTKKIITAPYPKKTINWKLINEAYKAGLITSEQDFQKYIGEYALNLDVPKGKNSTTFNVNKPTPVLEAGTGFMLIHKSVFKNFKEKYPEQMYEEAETGEERIAFFDCKIDKDKTYLSEDYMFCRWAKRIGYTIWSLPWIKLSHTGTLTYEGDFMKQSLLNKQLIDNGKFDILYPPKGKKKKS